MRPLSPFARLLQRLIEAANLRAERELADDDDRVPFVHRWRSPEYLREEW